VWFWCAFYCSQMGAGSQGPDLHQRRLAMLTEMQLPALGWVLWVGRRLLEPWRCPQGHAAELDAAAGFPAGAEWAGVGHPAQRAWGRVLEGFHRRGPRGRGPVAAGVTLGEAPLPGFAFAFGLKWHRLCLRASMAPQGSRGARTAPVLRPFGRVERCRWIASWGKLGWRWALGLGRRRQPRDAGQRATLVPLYGPRLS